MYWKKPCKYNAMKNYSDVQVSRNRSRNVKTNSKSTSECKEYHTAVLEDQGRTNRIQKLAHALKTHSRTEALITDLQKTGVFNPSSEESKRLIYNSGKIELFELGEVCAKT